MCGIAGGVNFRVSPEIVEREMGHRGPDATGTYITENISLVHLRLSILALEDGAQPMEWDNRYVILFNGEIYNHLEVREQLVLKCLSRSDTETILASFAKLGMGCVHHFDGMFAFCIYDRLEEQMYFARDRTGKKPFYWYHKGGQFVFASELNLLRALLPLQINQAAFPSYLQLGSGWIGQTPYEHVFELEPASWLVYSIKDQRVEKIRWWNIENNYDKVDPNMSEAIALEKVDQILQKGVERRLESSDLEVGCFLSGGIDSGLVTSIAAQRKPGLRTFTVSFDGAFNEGPLAQLVADKYGTRHTEISISMAGLQSEIEGIIRQYGEPFYDSSAIPTWYVSREAKKYLTVILNGDGADDIFAGYRRHALFSNFNFFKTPEFFRLLAGGLSKILPLSHDKKSYYNYLYRLLFLAGRQPAGAFTAAGSDIFEGFEHCLKFDSSTSQSFSRQLGSHTAKARGTGLQQMLLLDFNITLACDFLVKMDIGTMAHSLEGRSPFLCREMLEFAPIIPDHLKIKGKTTKYILRKLAEKYLPETLLKQPKRGFEVPLKQWINHELKTIVFDYLQSPNAFIYSLVQKEYVQQLLLNKVAVSQEKRAKQLYTLFCTEVWYQCAYLR